MAYCVFADLLLLRSSGPALLASRSVITSYSIHYTKLYDEVVACADLNIDSAKEKASLYSIPKAYGSSEELIADPEIDIVLNLTIPAVHAKINRITSYNVCYTKLLRSDYVYFCNRRESSLS